jgi:hypothetical protein
LLAAFKSFETEATAAFYNFYKFCDLCRQNLVGSEGKYVTGHSLPVRQRSHKACAECGMIGKELGKV